MQRRSRPLPAARDYNVAAPGRLPLLALWLPLLGVAGAIVAVILADSGPAHGAHWIGPCVLAATGAVMHALYLRRGIRLQGSALRIRSTMFNARTEIASIDLAHARVVDLAEHTELAPGRKLFGYGLPGFKSGHFRMRNGQRAFCLLTDASRVLALPLRNGRWLLLSPEQPRQLLQDLQRLAARSA